MPFSVIAMQKELEIFENYLTQRGFKHSAKRDDVVRTFLRTEKHVSTEDLLAMVRSINPEIGYTTVYRTLKLIEESGLAEQVDFNDGVKRFERKLGREYHAHFICTECGRTFEAFDSQIGQLSSALAKTRGFTPQKQRFEIFGVCDRCESR